MMDNVRQYVRSVEPSDTNAKRGFRWYTYLLYLFLYLPVLVVVVLSFTPSRAPTFPIPGFSFRWYEAILNNPRLHEALFTSLQIAVISAIGSGVIGTMAALGMVRNNFGSKWFNTQTFNTIFMAPIVVPWIVTGIAVLSLYTILGIQGTFLSLVIGHILITLPFVITIVSAQLYGFDRSVEEAAQNLGASELRTFYEVTLPIIKPGVIAGMLFAFTISFDNFTQTFFWSGTQTTTLPIWIYSKIRSGLTPSVNAIGTVIVLFSVTIALVGERLSSRLQTDDSAE